MSLSQNFADSLAMIQALHGWTFKQFVEVLEIGRSTLQEYLSGKSNPRLDTIEHIANKLQVDPAFLISFSRESCSIQTILYLMQFYAPLAELAPEDQEDFAFVVQQGYNILTRRKAPLGVT